MEDIVYLGGPDDGAVVGDARMLPELYADHWDAVRGLTFAVYSRTDRVDDEGRRVYAFLEVRDGNER